MSSAHCGDPDVRFGSKADICSAPTHVRFTPNSDRKSRHAQMVMSALPLKADMCGATRGQKRTWRSLDQFVGSREKRIWDGKTQGLGCPEIDYQFKLRRLFDRKVSWVCAFEYLINVVGGTTGHCNGVRSVRKKPAFFCPSSPSSGQRNPTCCRELDDSFYIQHGLTRRHDIDGIRLRTIGRTKC